MSKRLTKVEYYLNIAKEIASRSTCITRRQFGALLLKNGAIIATGYAGPVRGAINCGIDIPCLKDVHKEESNKSYNYCPSVHAEMNVIINAARNGVSTIDSTMFLNLINNSDNALDFNLDNRPCFLCRRFMIQAGIKDIYYVQGQGITYEKIDDWLVLENKWMEKNKDV